jgi:hypothetical protein
MKTMAATNANGTSTRTQAHQVHPEVAQSVSCRPGPGRAPPPPPLAAADTKLWKAKPVIWLRLLITLVAAACQFVLVKKLTPLNDSLGSTPLIVRAEQQVALSRNWA